MGCLCTGHKRDPSKVASWMVPVLAYFNFNHSNGRVGPKERVLALARVQQNTFICFGLFSWVHLCVCLCVANVALTGLIRIPVLALDRFCKFGSAVPQVLARLLECFVPMLCCFPLQSR